MLNIISEMYASEIEAVHSEFECCLEPGAWWDGCYEEPLPGEGLQCGCSKSISYLDVHLDVQLVVIVQINCLESQCLIILFSG